MKVCKFGGSSLADAAQVRKVLDIVTADPERRIVVVSAPGKRNKADTKVTDLLIAAARGRLAGQSGAGPLDEVVRRFEEMAAALDVTDDTAARIAADLRARLAGDTAHPERFLDCLKAAGEDANARLVAGAFRARGVPAQYVCPREAGMLLSAEFGRAQLLPESYARLAALADREERVIFPGFFGYTRDGDVVTFPRGGSDITGSILAAAVKADLYENFTDVDSVVAVDPRLVGGASPIPVLTYREMRELSYAGFGVLHDEAIIPAVQAGVPICIRNTNRPSAPGTMVVPERPYTGGQAVGIAGDGGFSTIYVGKYLMNREIGFGRRVLQILEDEGLSYEHMPSGIDNLSIILRAEGFSPEREARVLQRIREEMGVTDVEVEHGLALIMIVGEGMRYTVGVAARAVQALADAGVNIEMMNQGSSEISMMFGVKDADLRRAVRSLYRAFFGAHGEAEA